MESVKRYSLALPYSTIGVYPKATLRMPQWRLYLEFRELCPGHTLLHFGFTLEAEFQSDIVIWMHTSKALGVASHDHRK